MTVGRRYVASIGNFKLEIRARRTGNVREYWTLLAPVGSVANVPDDAVNVAVPFEATEASVVPTCVPSTNNFTFWRLLALADPTTVNLMLFKSTGLFCAEKVHAPTRLGVVLTFNSVPIEDDVMDNCASEGF